MSISPIFDSLTSGSSTQAGTWTQQRIFASSLEEKKVTKFVAGQVKRGKKESSLTPELCKKV